MNVLLTGATGFLGSRLAKVLNSKPDVSLTAAVRCLIEIPAAHIVEVQGLDTNTDWSTALTNQQTVIHAAARAHIMKDEVPDPLAEYRRVNVDGTFNLARQAAAAGVKRFVFISSIKVNGEQTPLGQPFTANDTPAPEDAYGISKWEAEQGLQQLASETGMEVVIIRPPLVYGPGVKGNFASMISLVKKGLPLPLGAIHNKRSLVAVDNLVDLIITCIDHPAAANQVFLAGDGHDLSTTELLRGVAEAMGKPSRLIPVPASMLKLGATMLGKKAVAQRLLGSLQVDISKARSLLGWEPPVSVEEGLKRCFK
ncbi:SDR family oxidoreductase [Marinobacterium sp. MBR-109]|jgi:nucleoside-diphosphate-sugar epimerase|uniref:UDP-glucose 4-epimerase family protein n=1 Tax=Marinobacterium sp. MBR-109 TaxID=3156462 RepID=UPI003392D265